MIGHENVLSKLCLHQFFQLIYQSFLSVIKGRLYGLIPEFEYPKKLSLTQSRIHFLLGVVTKAFH